MRPAAAVRATADTYAFAAMSHLSHPIARAFDRHSESLLVERSEFTFRGTINEVERVFNHLIKQLRSSFGDVTREGAHQIDNPRDT
jgi:hypothetical protein